VVKGKLAYMSPEQCRGKKVDRRADVFSLGVTLYELSTRRRAFRSDSEYQTMERIVRGELATPSSLVAGYPPALEQIVLKAVATDPAARYQTAAELGAALEAFGRAHGVEEPRPVIAGFMRTLFGEPRTPQEVAAEATAAAEAARTDAEQVEETAEAVVTGETAAMEAAAPPVIMTGPMPVVAAPGPTAAMPVPVPVSLTAAEARHVAAVRGWAVKVAAGLLLLGTASVAVELAGGQDQRVDPMATGTLTRERAPVVPRVVEPVPATLERRTVADPAEAKNPKPPDPEVEVPKDPQTDAGEATEDLSAGRY
jgi:serine/threonine-protein kinase